MIQASPLTLKRIILRLSCLLTLFFANFNTLFAQGIDEQINRTVQPIVDALNKFIFFGIPVLGTEVPLIVFWLVSAAIFFTFYFRFLNITGFRHAIALVKGAYSTGKDDGEVSHFQALVTALSGTVGIGNIGGVAILITIGGPGALFWMIFAGLMGMSTKFVECILGVMYRKVKPDGSISGGPMYYLEKGLVEKGLSSIAKPLGNFYAISMVIGCMGIGNMFQSNQAFEQFVFITGGTESWFADKGWLFGLGIALLVGLVILGGLKSIAKVTGKLVPFMGVTYVAFAVTIILMNIDQVPWAFQAIFTQAFTPEGMTGGMIGVMVLGFKRAVFSNEAGIGSASIVHSAVKTNEPVTEGYVALLEPFIDTVVICTMTGLVILTTLYDPNLSNEGVQGVELTSKAFAANISWSVVPLSFIAILFAFSTMISWSYYGLKGWTYLFGESEMAENIFKLIFCGFVALGCTIQLGAVLDFSDAMVFLVSIPNIIGLYILAPTVKKALKDYQRRLENGEIEKIV
ncbi:MAG: alanine/glycine:cation symporter family protein [Bacteroidota bacterium]